MGGRAAGAAQAPGASRRMRGDPAHRSRAAGAHTPATANTCLPKGEARGQSAKTTTGKDTNCGQERLQDFGAQAKGTEGSKGEETVAKATRETAHTSESREKSRGQTADDSSKATPEASKTTDQIPDGKDIL